MILFAPRKAERKLHVFKELRIQKEVFSTSQVKPSKVGVYNAVTNCCTYNIISTSISRFNIRSGNHHEESLGHNLYG